MIKKEKSIPNSSVFYIKGMHCASCEILIEKEILNIPGVHFVDASLKNNRVNIQYTGKEPKEDELNKIFKNKGYIFSSVPIEKEEGNIFNILAITSVVFLFFIIFTRAGIGSFISINESSSLVAFLLLGLIAGFSSCAALIGGLLLSLSKYWNKIYPNQGFFKRTTPYLMFNFGRIFSFGILGYILGLIGQKIQLSLSLSSVLVIAISIFMIFFALQMLGFKYLNRINISLPKFITRYISSGSNMEGKYVPFLIGGLTFFLPCGFTATAQGFALISGNPIQSSLIMMIFALGTTPALLIIGFSSLKFLSDYRFSSLFSKAAAVILLFFAFFNINSQASVIGIPNLNTLFVINKEEIKDNFPPIIDGKQIIKMEASSSGYKPNYFKVKLNVPVRWEITDVGTSGCTNAIISRNLFNDKISLTPGKTSIKEFIPSKPGRYIFSCWMGMVSGVIEVI